MLNVFSKTKIIKSHVIIAKLYNTYINWTMPVVAPIHNQNNHADAVIEAAINVIMIGQKSARRIRRGR